MEMQNDTETEEENTDPRPVTISLALKTKEDLYAANMPFIKEGGLFVATSTEYPLGSPVRLQLELMDEIEIFAVEGKIVWKTPQAAQGNMDPGIGIQFTSKEAKEVLKKINAYLVGTSASEDRTDTM